LNALVIARFALMEAVSRRVVVAGVLLSVAFLALYALGFSLIYAEVLRESLTETPRPNRPAPVVMFGNVFTVMGMYAVHFLSSFLALFLAVGAIASEVESGALHAVLARPMRRWELVVGRWLAAGLMICLYVGVMAASVLLIAQTIAGYEAPRPAQAIGLMMLGAVLLVTLSVFGSTLLSTVANGVVIFSLFGLSWLAGLIEVIGGVLSNAAMVNVGIAVSLLVPIDSIWRAASFYIQSPAVLMAVNAASRQGGIPFAGSAEPAAAQVAWGVLYPLVFLAAAVLSFSRRDL
jgi:Cu-processing system permease protein